MRPYLLLTTCCLLLAAYCLLLAAYCLLLTAHYSLLLLAHQTVTEWSLRILTTVIPLTCLPLTARQAHAYGDPRDWAKHLTGRPVMQASRVRLAPSPALTLTLTLSLTLTLTLSLTLSLSLSLTRTLTWSIQSHRKPPCA